MGIIEQMLAAQTMTENLIAELRSAGLDDFTIASVIFNQAGRLWRENLPNMDDRRKIIGHAAEVAITGLPQPVS